MAGSIIVAFGAGSVDVDGSGSGHLGGSGAGTRGVVRSMVGSCRNSLGESSVDTNGLSLEE